MSHWFLSTTPPMMLKKINMSGMLMPVISEMLARMVSLIRWARLMVADRGGRQLLLAGILDGLREAGVAAIGGGADGVPFGGADGALFLLRALDDAPPALGGGQAGGAEGEHGVQGADGVQRVAAGGVTQGGPPVAAGC